MPTCSTHDSKGPKANIARTAAVVPGRRREVGRGQEGLACLGQTV